MVKTTKFCSLLGWNMPSACPITSSPAFCYQWFPVLPKLHCSGICCVDDSGLELKDRHVSDLLIAGIKGVNHHAWTKVLL